MGKKTLKQKMQAMADETSNAQNTKDSKLTQNEAKFHVPNQPSV
ncbi:MAG: hypothetical protein K0R57_3765 [Paenibacillaceae bacterium]|nr:hypothetical protein [Paenibacillaceae bacterium]